MSKPRPKRLVAWVAATIGLLSLASAVLLAIGPAALAQEAQAVDEYGQPVMTEKQIYCSQLEQQLAHDPQLGEDPRARMLRIEAEIAKLDAQFQRGQAVAESSDCFDYFLFTKEWRRTPRCEKLRQGIEAARSRLAELAQQREEAARAQDHGSRQEAVLAELARNGCGPQYQTTSRPATGGGLWSDSEGVDPTHGAGAWGGQPGVATYRTICVRLCDGYFFPISFATTEGSFPRDAEACHSQCAAPAQLYYYQNPGSEMDQAVALDGSPYSQLRTAFLYRKKLVQGCSCRAAEIEAASASGLAAGESDPLAAGDQSQAGFTATTSTPEIGGAAPDQAADPLQQLLDAESQQPVAPPKKSGGKAAGTANRR